MIIGGASIVCYCFLWQAIKAGDFVRDVTTVRVAYIGAAANFRVGGAEYQLQKNANALFFAHVHTVENYGFMSYACTVLEGFYFRAIYGGHGRCSSATSVQNRV